MGRVVVLVNTSLMETVPMLDAWLMPATAALLHAKLADGVALVGVYVNVPALQIAAGVNVLLNTGVGFTVSTTS